MAFLAPTSVFDKPSPLYLILDQPARTLLRLIDLVFSALLNHQHSNDRSHIRQDGQSPSPRIRVVCISDTHTLQCAIPDGDILIHAGDLTNDGTPAELQAQIDWLDSQPHKYKVAIAGNHDSWLDARCRPLLSDEAVEGSVDWKGVRYLQHAATTLHFTSKGQISSGAAAASSQRSICIFGAPQIPACGPEVFAFQYPPSHDAWSGTVPDGVDILVTHTPPRSHLDLPSARRGNDGADSSNHGLGLGLGCPFLLAECWRVKPRVHVFGHVHAARTEPFGRWTGGREIVRWDARQAAFEAALVPKRTESYLLGWIDLSSWLGCLRVAWLGVSDLLWERVWGGESHSSSNRTLMINAALMFENTGRLGNEPQVFDM